MQWYRVVKTIKGHRYLYRQRTYREGGKVRTQSQYIGPMNAEAETRSGTLRNPPPDVTPQFDIQKEVNTTEIQPDRPEEPARPIPLKIRANIDKHQISRTSLEKEHERMLKRLEALGLDASQTPRILVADGSKVGMRRRLTGGYKVTMARRVRRGTGGRTAFRREYRKALAHMWLDEIERQHPLAFEQLRTDLNSAYQATKWAMLNYILQMQTPPPKYRSVKKRVKVGRRWKTVARKLKVKQGPSRWALTLQILWSGQLPQSIRSKYSPQAFGLPDHERHRGWRDDSAAFVAEVMQCGYDKTVTRYRNEWRKADAAMTRAVNVYQSMGWRERLTGERSRQRTILKRAIARRTAVGEAGNKLALLERYWRP